MQYTPINDYGFLADSTTVPPDALGGHYTVLIRDIHDAITHRYTGVSPATVAAIVKRVMHERHLLAAIAETMPQLRGPVRIEISLDD